MHRLTTGLFTAQPLYCLFAALMVGLLCRHAAAAEKIDPLIYGDAIVPQLIDSSHGVQALAVADGTLYTVGNGSLSIYRLSGTPAKPVKIGALKGLPAWSMRQLCIHRGYAYITARHQGLWVVDVRNPANPALAGVVPTVELATGIAAQGDALFLTMRIYGIEIFDLSDPAKPRHVNLVRTHEAQSACCAGTWMAAGDWGSSSVMLFDIADPGRPAQLSEIPLDGFGDGVFIAGNTLYASTGHHARAKKQKQEPREGRGHGMEIFDISNPKRPVRLGGVKFPPYYELGNDFWSLIAVGDTVFCADTGNGLFVVDASDRSRPAIRRHLRLPASKRQPRYPECISSLALADGMVFFGGAETGLYAFPDAAAREIQFCMVFESRNEISSIVRNVLKSGSDHSISWQRCRCCPKR